MSDIVEKLRSYASSPDDYRNKAADEIERLRSLATQHHQGGDGYMQGVRDAVTFLHKHADQSTSSSIKTVINSMANAIGNELKRDALAQQPLSVQEGWRPIETAPKDGTQIIVFTRWAGDSVSEPFDKIQMATWSDGNDLDPSDDFYREGGWDLQFIGDPISWQPLPAAPTVGGTEE